jgi:hypothetical protein
MEEYADIEIKEDLEQPQNAFPVNRGEEELVIEDNQEEVFMGVKEILNPTTPK